MIFVSEEKIAGVKYTNITLTRGDDATLVLPIFSVAADGTRTPYTPLPGDTFKLQVRSEPITRSGQTPTVIFNGTITVVDGKPNWTISATDSTQNCGKYYWDAQITTGGKIYTFYQGWLTIFKEATE